MISPPPKMYSGDEIKVDEMGGTCGTCGGDENAYRVLVGKPEGKRPLGRSRSRCEQIY
jgi:hypothetical protein